MDPTLACFRYRWDSRTPLNALTARTVYEGVLVRQDGGYACLHPWPELGDAPLERQVRALVSGEDTSLTRSAQHCMDIDREARREGRHLLGPTVNLPSSHATLTESSLEAVLQAARHGFTSAKVKGHPDERRLEALAELLDASPLPLRIDFNETLTVARLVAWHGQLSPTAQQRIEFVEDPCPYRVEDWQALRAATGWTLAVDRAAPHASHGFEIFVFKPAVMPLEPVLRWVANGGEAVLVTSYMDHPLGQLYAAYQASQLAARHPQLRLMGGLATHTLFNDLPASLDLGNGPDLHLPSGTGLGLDDYLTTLPWEPLTQ